MAKILFVDNKVSEYDRFMDLEFAQAHKDEITFMRDPLKAVETAMSDPDLRLIILDMLWEQGAKSAALPEGLSILSKLAKNRCTVPVVIHSVIGSKEELTNYFFEAERLGAFDWISKNEPRHLRCARLERAYLQGRRIEQTVLAREEPRRPNVAIACMFVDLSGFTALTEQIGHGDVVSILESFYKLVGDAVFHANGYVDKYIGDAVLAAFGANREPTDGLAPAVTAAIQSARHIVVECELLRLKVIEPLLSQRLTRLTPDQKALTGKCRVGIESGTVDIVRFTRGAGSDVTFVGTAVNLASRIIGKASQGEIWIGQNAYSNGGAAQVSGEGVPTQYKGLPGEYFRYRVA